MATPTINLEATLNPILEMLVYAGKNYEPILMSDDVINQFGLSDLLAIGLPLDGLFKGKWVAGRSRFYYAAPGIWLHEGQPVIMFGYGDGGPLTYQLPAGRFLVKGAYDYTTKFGNVVVGCRVHSDSEVDEQVLTVDRLRDICKELPSGGSVAPRIIDSLDPLAVNVFEPTAMPADIPGSKFPRCTVMGILNGEPGTWQVPGKLGKSIAYAYLMKQSVGLEVARCQFGPYAKLVS